VEENLEEKECEQEMLEKRLSKETTGKTERGLRDLDVQMLLSVQ
jgi:hypothetical protein